MVQIANDRKMSSRVSTRNDQLNLNTAKKSSNAELMTNPSIYNFTKP